VRTHGNLDEAAAPRHCAARPQSNGRICPIPDLRPGHLRVDTDVLEWFKAQGRGHLSRMNAVLRSFMEAQKQHRRR
jgi:uncharacterized protein (DUF4415 family)